MYQAEERTAAPMADTTSMIAPRSRASYQAWVNIPIRFGDIDSMGHVNNAVIATYFEHARCMLVMPQILPAARGNLNVVLARIIIDYVREIRFPGAVDVGVRVSRIGGKSFAVAGAVFIGETCFATSEATMVFFNTATRTAMEPTPEARAMLAAMQSG